MTMLSSLPLDIRMAVYFSAVAALISLLLGGITGVDFMTILIRMGISVPLFGALGFGSIFLVKKFVPEMFEAVSNQGSPGDELGEEGSNEPDIMAESDGFGEDGIVEEGLEGAEPGSTSEAFTELESNDLTNVTAQGRQGQAGMGKHIVKDGEMNYEPKLMAQAIRTMMSRDEE
jgi:hypothetical protein